MGKQRKISNNLVKLIGDRLEAVEGNLGNFGKYLDRVGNGAIAYDSSYNFYLDSAERVLCFVALKLAGLSGQVIDEGIDERKKFDELERTLQSYKIVNSMMQREVYNDVRIISESGHVIKQTSSGPARKVEKIIAKSVVEEGVAYFPHRKDGLHIPMRDRIMI